MEQFGHEVGPVVGKYAVWCSVHVNQWSRKALATAEAVVLRTKILRIN